MPITFTYLCIQVTSQEFCYGSNMNQILSAWNSMGVLKDQGNYNNITVCLLWFIYPHPKFAFQSAFLALSTLSLNCNATKCIYLGFLQFDIMKKEPEIHSYVPVKHSARLLVSQHCYSFSSLVSPI